MPRAPRRWYRPRNVILFILGLIAALIGREVYLDLTATPGHAVNYFDKATQLVESYQPPGADATPDAWPILIDAIDRMTQADLTGPPGGWSVNTAPLDYNALYAVPDKPKYDDTHTWEEVRARAREGQAALRAAGVFSRLADLTTARRAVRPLPDTGHMLEVLLPELGKARQIARAQAGRMALASESGDDADFVAAYEETLALARLFGHQFTLIDHLVALAIEALALDRLREHLADHPFEQATLRALLDATDRQMPLPPLSLPFEGERLSCLDTIQWTHTDNGRGSGRFIPETLRSTGLVTGTSGTGNGVLDTLAEWHILNLASAAFPSKAATTARINEFFDGATALTKPGADPRAPGGGAFNVEEFVDKTPKRYVLIHLLLPAVGAAVRSRHTADMQLDGTRLMLAIELFNAKNGRYPATLDELVPSIFPALPTDAISGKGFGYRLLKPEEDQGARSDGSPRPYLLYSFGADGRDNHGLPSKREWDALRAAGAGTDYILNTPPPKPKPADDAESPPTSDAPR
jgi:hypothetical protein